MPEQFSAEPLEGLEHVDARKMRGRKVIRGRTDRSLEGYDAWRCTDRTVPKGDGKHYGQRTINMPPAALVRTFGEPEMTQIMAHGSGQYDFEDANLDAFSIFDYKQTTLYHGLNREDEYYLTEVNLRKPHHKRKRKWPSIDEFWSCEEPMPFRFVCDDYAQWRKFLRWIRKEVAARERLGGAFEDEIEARFGSEFDISHGEWEHVGVINHDDIAVFKYDYTYHLNEAELKALKEKPEPIVRPIMFDLAQAERVFVDKDEIKRQEEEEKADLMDA